MFSSREKKNTNANANNQLQTILFKVSREMLLKSSGNEHKDHLVVNTVKPAQTLFILTKNGCNVCFLRPPFY